MLIRCCLAILALGGAASGLHAQTAVVLAEAPGGYHVRSTVELTGQLTLPATGGKNAPGSLAIRGRSQIAYDERPLAASGEGTPRTVRIYRQADFGRVVNGTNYETSIRPEVRRMVILRRGTREVPFSPDGPLKFGEIDMVRTDLFTPALAGLLPAGSVAPDERWKANAAVVEEITDFEKIEQGSLECRLTQVAGRTATIAFSGLIQGVNEDGPVRQQIDGTVSFDLVDRLITALQLSAVKTLLDSAGKATGRVEGRVTLTRQRRSAAEISDAGLRNLTLEPNSTNTLLVYEGSNVAFRFNYSRRWRISAEQGRQVTLEDRQGNGIFLTLEPPEKVPSAAEYLNEATGVIAKQKGRLLRTEPPVKLRGGPWEVERFGLDIEVDRKPARMEYAIMRQQLGGATLAARLVPADAPALTPEVDEIAKSLRIGTAAPAGVIPLPGPGK